MKAACVTGERDVLLILGLWAYEIFNLYPRGPLKASETCIQFIVEGYSCSSIPGEEQSAKYTHAKGLGLPAYLAFGLFGEISYRT